MILFIKKETSAECLEINFGQYNGTDWHTWH